MKAFAFIVGLVSAWILNAGAHGRSEEMIRTLNAPPPDWLTLAEPIKVEPAKEGVTGIIDQSQFRDPSDGIILHNGIQIPRLGIVLELDHDISPSMQYSPSVSLSPDETRLVANDGDDVYLYEIGADGQVTEDPTQVPSVTYDKGLKGFISYWLWASNDLLLGHTSITDEKEQSMLENRLYTFHTGTRSLARLDLSALDHLREPNYPNEPPMFDVVSVGKDLSELVLEVNGVNTVRVKADLKSPHKLIPASSQETLGQTATPGRSPIFSPSLAVRPPPPVRQSFPWLWLLAIVGVLLGVFSYLYRSSRPR